MRPRKRSQTKRRPMASRERPFRLWSASQKREKCLGGKKISFGPGSSTYIRLCCSFTKAATFDQSALPGKAVLAHLLLARIALQVGDSAEAQKETSESVARLKYLQTPVLVYQARFLEGQIAQACNDRHAAHQAYLEARKALEALRSRLQGEELKISFVKNRMQVYEALVDLYIAGDGTGASAEEAFACMEAAKSRSMIELIFQSGQSLPLGDAGQSDLVRRIRDLREELNWYYHRIELE